MSQQDQEREMEQLTIGSLRALHTPQTFACPTEGCEVFAFETQAELDDHIAKGDHVIRTASGRFETVSNGFGGTTTRRVGADQPRFRRGAGHVPSGDPYTEPQDKLLRKLLAERAGIDAAETVRAKINRWRSTPQGLTKAGASAAIDELLKIEPVRKVATTTQRVRTNRFPGKCEECGKQVEAEEGRLSKGDDGKWQVWHLEGRCPASSWPFPNGRYAVVHDGVLKFYVADDDGIFVQASDETHLLRGDTAHEVIALIAEDPEAASRRYGQEIGVCGRCGRTLTDEGSRAAGIGPICATKGWS
jgi:hypothetical protein